MATTNTNSLLQSYDNNFLRHAHTLGQQASQQLYQQLGSIGDWATASTTSWGTSAVQDINQYQQYAKGFTADHQAAKTPRNRISFYRLNEKCTADEGEALCPLDALRGKVALWLKG